MKKHLTFFYSLLVIILLLCTSICSLFFYYSYEQAIRFKTLENTYTAVINRSYELQKSIAAKKVRPLDADAFDEFDAQLYNWASDNDLTVQNMTTEDHVIQQKDDYIQCKLILSGSSQQLAKFMNKLDHSTTLLTVISTKYEPSTSKNITCTIVYNVYKR